MLESDPEGQANVFLGGQRPLRLECGVELKNFPVAYQTYGKLNSEKSMELSRSNWISGIPSGKNLRKSMSSRANHDLHFSPKIIKIVRRSAEIDGVKVHRCTGGVPLAGSKPLPKNTSNFVWQLMYQYSTSSQKDLYFEPKMVQKRDFWFDSLIFFG